MTCRRFPGLPLVGFCVALSAFVAVTPVAWAARQALDAEAVVEHPFPGITCRQVTRSSPPTRMFVAEVDLSNPLVHVRVAPGGPDPDGPGKWQTTLMEPTRIGAREGFDLVVNGDFFDARGVHDAEGAKAAYRPGLWGAVVGPAVTDGVVWSVGTNIWPCLVVHRDQTVAIERFQHPPPEAFEVVAGNTLLVEHGSIVSHRVKTRHPRTAVGLDQTGKHLMIVVVDGRKPKVAVGMSFDELAHEMLSLGCREALNLDGGGSSVMALRSRQTGTYRLLNQPTDGHERAVANVLGITVTGTDPARN